MLIGSQTRGWLHRLCRASSARASKHQCVCWRGDGGRRTHVLHWAAVSTQSTPWQASCAVPPRPAIPAQLEVGGGPDRGFPGAQADGSWQCRVRILTQHFIAMRNTTCPHTMHGCLMQNQLQQARLGGSARMAGLPLHARPPLQLVRHWREGAPPAHKSYNGGDLTMPSPPAIVHALFNETPSPTCAPYPPAHPGYGGKPRSYCVHAQRPCPNFK